MRLRLLVNKMLSSIFLLVIVIDVGPGVKKMRIAAYDAQKNTGRRNVIEQITKGFRSTILNQTILEENPPENKSKISVATSWTPETNSRRFFNNFDMPLKLNRGNLLFNQHLHIKQTNESIEHNDYGILKPVVIYGKKMLNTLGHFVNYGQKFTQEQILKNSNVNGIKTDTLLHNMVEQLSNNEIDQKLEISSHANGGELFKKLTKSLEVMDRKFYLSTFTVLSANTATDTSFVQSGLALQLLLTALSMETDSDSSAEIHELTGFNQSIEEETACLKYAMAWLPASSDVFKMLWSSRLVLNSRVALSPLFEERIAPALRMTIHRLNDSVNENPSILAYILNNMVEMDSGGALRDTFDAQEVSEGVQVALLSTLYVRAAWRVAPTLLNGSWPFLHGNSTHAGLPRMTRMFRLNDIVGYAYLEDWDAEAVEVPYATAGLSMLAIMARSGRLRELAARLGVAGLQRVLASLRPRRVALSLPLYTLRMGLLLPSKLKFMGVSRIWSGAKKMAANASDEFRISHAVQRIMFWGDTGRNAFKDDGLVWEEPPESNLTLDRPYVFFVRWHGVTLLNGNFAL